MPRVCPVVITLAATARTRDLPDATGLSRAYHVCGYHRGNGTYLMPRACPVVITLAATAREWDLPDARACPVVITLAATARARDLPDATGLSRAYHVCGYQRGNGTYLMPRACPVVITLAA